MTTLKCARHQPGDWILFVFFSVHTWFEGWVWGLLFQTLFETLYKTLFETLKCAWHQPGDWILYAIWGLALGLLSTVNSWLYGFTFIQRKFHKKHTIGMLAKSVLNLFGWVSNSWLQALRFWMGRKPKFESGPSWQHSFFKTNKQKQNKKQTNKQTNFIQQSILPPPPHIKLHHVWIFSQTPIVIELLLLCKIFFP